LVKKHTENHQQRKRFNGYLADETCQKVTNNNGREASSNSLFDGLLVTLQRFDSVGGFLVNTPSVQLLKKTGYINEQSFVCTFDTGATISIMSDLIADKLGLKLNEANINVNLANGSSAKVSGVTSALKFTVFDRVIDMVFLILPIREVEILVGLDWFHKARAGIIPYSNKIFFNSEDGSCGDTIDICENEQSFLVETADETDLEGDFDWNMNAEDQILFQGSALNEEQKDEVEKVFPKMKHLFASSLDSLGCCNVIKHKIELISNTPICLYPFRMPLKYREELKRITDEMERAGVVRESKSPYSFRMFLVP
jgi:hypothetical protein